MQFCKGGVILSIGDPGPFFRQGQQILFCQKNMSNCPAKLFC